MGGGRVEILVEDGDKTNTEVVVAERGIILATGSGCKHLPFIEMDHKQTIDSDDILALKSVPGSLVVVGAGAVGTEFASIFHRFGEAFQDDYRHPVTENGALSGCVEGSGMPIR